MAGISGDAAQLDPLFDTFITALTTAASADVALQGAIANVGTARDDFVAKRNAAIVAYNSFLRRIGTASMTAAQRQAFKRVFGDIDDTNPNELGGAVKLAAGG
jgi:hypothetical protein